MAAREEAARAGAAVVLRARRRRSLGLCGSLTGVASASNEKTEPHAGARMGVLSALGPGT